MERLRYDSLARGFVVSLVVLLLLSSLQTRVVGLQSSQNVRNFGTIEYGPKVFRVLLVDDLTVEQRNNASFLAMHLDLYITKEWQGRIVEQIHAINPDVKVLLYRNVMVIKSFDPEWKTALEGGWLLRDSEGKLINSTTWSTHSLVDIGNQEYREFIVTWLNNYFSLFGFDGVFADNCIKSSVDHWSGGQTGTPINPRTGKLYTDEEIREDIISFINYVKSQIGSKLWLSNGIFQGEWFFNKYYDFVKVLTESSLDGFMSEGLFNWGVFYSEEKWKKSVDFVVWIQETFLNQVGKIFVPNGRCVGDAYIPLPSGATTEQMGTFVFSSLLLGINSSQNYLSLQGAMLLNETQNLFEIYLGVPKGDYYIIEGTHVYARDFTKAKVLVNPTGEPFSVYLDGNYETLAGKTVSSLNMDPHTGLILKAT